MSEPVKKDQSAARQAARVIARNLWIRDFKAENPKASKEDIDSAWKDVRTAQVDNVMKGVRAAERSGLKITKVEES